MPTNIESSHIYGISNTAQQTVIPVTKVWGKEYIVPTEGYTSKYMFVLPGGECSKHLHKTKNENFTLIEGILQVLYFDKAGNEYRHVLRNRLDTLLIPSGIIHSFCVPTSQGFPTLFIESSTIDNSEDSYRISKSTLHDNLDNW